MAAELVNAATTEKLTEMDWTKNIEICELVAHDPRQAKDVIKAIKKRLGNKNTNTQLYAVMLLEMLMNNIGETVHKQVIDSGILPILVKIVKKKSDLPVRERIFLLLDAMQTSLGGASGKFPQYYNAYHDLVNAGVQFPQSSHDIPSNQPTSQTNTTNIPNGVVTDSRHEEIAEQVEPQNVPESSIIQKASNALEVLNEVLDAVDPQHPEGAKDEFTLDLVEQCSFQKQRVMHLVMTSRNEKIVSQAIELNEQLQLVLSRHDTLLSGRTTTADHFSQDRDAIHPVRSHSNADNFSEEEVEEEEEAEQLFRRIRKGKAHARPEDEEHVNQQAFLVPSDKLNRPLIRPVSLEPSHKQETHAMPWPLSSEQSHEPGAHPVPVVIPPPPARHIEREKFFKENKVDSSAVANHVRGLSLHSHNGSSSRSGSIDFSD